MRTDSKLVHVTDRFMLEAFRAHDYNKVRTAKYLDCGLRTVQRNLKRLGIPESNCRITWDETAREPIAKAVEEVLQSLPKIKIRYEGNEK